jgi:hypothetical protein
MAKAPAMGATGVSRTWMAARFTPPDPDTPLPPPLPDPLDPLGAVAAGRRAVDPGVEPAPLVAGGAVAGTVDVVVSGTVDSEGDGPVARSRWSLWPPLPHAAANSARTKRAATSLRRTNETVPTMTR